MYQSGIPGPDESIQYLSGGATATVYSGGSRSWRTHNPGEIGSGLIAVEHGAIGRFGGVAIFGSRAAGRKALRAVLAGREVIHLTVEQAYRRFSMTYRSEQPATPAVGPEPPAPVCPYTGIEATLPMSELGAAERERMAEAIEHDLIGWREGEVREEALAAGSLNDSHRSVVGGNVLINGRSAVHAGSRGRLSTMDVCNTPAGKGCKPVLYGNNAVSADATGTAATVLINGHPACIESSSFSRSSGDEGGRCGGVRSGTTRGPAHFITGSGNVRIEGEPAVRQFDLMVSNNRNTAPMPLMQPGAAPPPALLAKALKEGEATAGPNAVRVDLEALGMHSLHSTLVATVDGERHPAPLPSGLGIAERHPIVLAGLPAESHAALALTLPSSDKGEITVALTGDVPSAPFDPEADPELEAEAGRHVLAPLVFARDLEGGSEPEAPAHAPVRPGGRIYVFREGLLWREIAIVEHSWYREVDLAEHRPAEGVPISHVLLPAQLHGEAQHYQIAYAEIPWTEQRLDALETDAAERERRCTEVAPDTRDGERIREHRGNRTVILPDELALAREHARHCHALVEEMALTESARSTGAPALARLIQGLAEADRHNRAERPGEVDGEPLAEQLKADDTGAFEFEYERTLDDWRRFDEALAEAHEKAVSELVAILERDSFQATLEDYFTAEAPRHELLGAVHWAWLVGAAIAPPMRAFHTRALAGDIPALAWLGHPGERLASDLRELEKTNKPLPATDEDLQHLSPALLQEILLDTGETLKALVDAIAEAHLSAAGEDSAPALEATAEVVTRYTRVEIALVHVPVATIMAQPVGTRPHAYVYRPAAYVKAVAKLTDERFTVPQLAPAKGGFPATVAQLREHPLFRGGLFGTLGVLHVMNAGVALTRLAREFSTENAMGAAGGIGGATSFYAGLAKEIFEREVKAVAARRLALEGRQRLLQLRAERGISSAVGRAAIDRSKLLNEQIERMAGAGKDLGGSVLRARFFFILGGSLAAIADVGIGARYLVYGATGGNKVVAAGGSALAFGGAASGAGVAMMALKIPSLSVAGIAISSGALLFGGGVLALAGILLIALWEDGPLVKALRHGAFGTDPDPQGLWGWEYEGYEHIEAEPFADQALLPDVTLDIAAREAELDEIMRLLYGFRPQLGVRALQGTEGRAEAVIDRYTGVTLGSSEVVVEARLDFAQMIPASTTVEVELYLERGSRLWLDGDSRHLRLGDRDLMVCQFRDGERLTALACYTRVPLAAVQGGIRLLARLDVDGSGLHTVPKNGDFIERTWALSAHPQLGRISAHEWDNVRANALPPAALPGRDTGEPSGTGNPGERSDR